MEESGLGEQVPKIGHQHMDMDWGHAEGLLKSVDEWKVKKVSFEEFEKPGGIIHALREGSEAKNYKVPFDLSEERLKEVFSGEKSEAKIVLQGLLMGLIGENLINTYSSINVWAENLDYYGKNADAEKVKINLDRLNDEKMMQAKKDTLLYSETVWFVSGNWEEDASEYETDVQEAWEKGRSALLDSINTSRASVLDLIVTLSGDHTRRTCDVDKLEEVVGERDAYVVEDLIENYEVMFLSFHNRPKEERKLFDDAMSKLKV